MAFSENWTFVLNKFKENFNKEIKAFLIPEILKNQVDKDTRFYDRLVEWKNFKFNEKDYSEVTCVYRKESFPVFFQLLGPNKEYLVASNQPLVPSLTPGKNGSLIQWRFSRSNWFDTTLLQRDIRKGSNRDTFLDRLETSAFHFFQGVSSYIDPIFYKNSLNSFQKEQLKAFCQQCISKEDMEAILAADKNTKVTLRWFWFYYQGSITIHRVLAIGGHHAEYVSVKEQTF